MNKVGVCTIYCSLYILLLVCSLGFSNADLAFILIDILSSLQFTLVYVSVSMLENMSRESLRA